MSTTDDERAIRDIIAAQEAAWNAGDADAYAAPFHVEGSFTNVFGDRHIGRDAFRARHAAIFSTFAQGSRATLTAHRVHFPTPDTAIVDIDCVLTTHGALPPALRPAPDGTARTSLLQVLVREGHQWWTVAYHNVSVTPLPGPRS